jgi:hypothetical protein
MVALAHDWRLAEERAWRFMNPARVVERYRQINGRTNSPLSSCPSYKQMLAAVVEHDLGVTEPPDAASLLSSE